jgi:DNA mismatch endonuclease (patch repair protein)
MMSGIRAKNTRPELALRKALHARGFRYRLHSAGVPGKPDIVLPRYRAAVFVHGCFWHGHDCHLFRLPGTRTDFWQEKIGRNQIRDAVVTGELAEQGWRQLAIWECAIRGRTKIGLEAAVDQAVAWLEGDAMTGDIHGNG